MSSVLLASALLGPALSVPGAAGAPGPWVTAPSAGDAAELLAAGPATRDAGDEALAREARALLSERCFACHGPDASAREAGLRLDRAEGLDAVARGERAELLERVRSSDPDLVMPPPGGAREPLSAEEVALLERWSAAGAPVAEHWSLAPLARVQEPAPGPWGVTTLDALVQQGLREAGLEPAPDADPRTLARRLSLDLTGLPPDPDRVAELAADPSAAAFLVYTEELLASPHHAERLAVWWLDLVRYGDSSGYHSDRPVPLWPYRDWVLEALQGNLAFDEFTRAQIAGDLLPELGDEGDLASVYHRLCKVTDEGGAQAGEYLVKYAADRVRTLGTAWLGLTVGCAQCHDHKYDPLSQREFYELAAFFADIEQVGVYELRDYRAFQPLGKVQREDGAEVTFAATVSVEPMETRVLERGDWLSEGGEVVQPGTPDLLPSLGVEGRRATRADLAEWLVRPDHPLVPRVVAARLWELLMGQPLVPVADDFGAQGGRPFDARLLDWLAGRFVATGFDLRDLVRTIVSSRAYAQSSRPRPELDALPPSKRPFGRAVPRRLEAEFVRDALLATSGLLDRTVGGPSVFPYQPEGYWQHLNFPRRRWRQSEGSDLYRRGLYTHWQRTFVHPFLLAFDAPTREESVARRARSNGPLAALALLDGPTALDAARALAGRALERRPEAPLDAMVELVLQRPVTDAERVVLAGLVLEGPGRSRAEALYPAARALLNTSEAITRP